jgi:hypothetical protein
MSYVYKRTEPNLWTVGHYAPDGFWTPESDHNSDTDAAERTRWLNGAGSPAPIDGPRTIVFEVPHGGVFSGDEALVQLWPGEVPTIAFRQDRGTWGPPTEASKDEDEALRQTATRAADRMLRQRIEAIPDARLREELLKSL